MLKLISMTCLALFVCTGCTTQSESTQTITLTCNGKVLVEKTFKSKEECRAFSREADYSCGGEKMKVECN